MGLPELRRTAQVVYGANEPSPFRLVFISQTLTENPQNMSPHWREGMFCGFCCGMDMDSLLKCFVLIGFTQPLDKLEFGEFSTHAVILSERSESKDLPTWDSG